MKFTANTKPISEGLELGIISSNITKFYQKSCIVELTLEDNGLRVNTEASSIKSELLFKGKVEGDGQFHVFIDSLLFKNLIKTIDSDVIQFEFKEDGLVIYSENSKFNLPQIISGEDLELSRPKSLESINNAIEVDKSGWEFVKNNQMYAIAMSFIHPVYTNVWISDLGDVIVGDFDNSIFTHSGKVQLSSTCLITDTIVNLLTTIPENSKIIQLGKNYEIQVETDPYLYICEFSPRYEEDEGVGSYSADIILSLFNKSDIAISLDTSKISKYIAQAELFSSSNDDLIKVIVNKQTFSLMNQNINCSVPIMNPSGDFEITFKLSLLKDALMHLDEEKIQICPLIQNNEVAGLILWTDNMETMLAGVESGE